MLTAQLPKLRKRLCKAPDVQPTKVVPFKVVVVLVHFFPSVSLLKISLAIQKNVDVLVS